MTAMMTGVTLWAKLLESAVAIPHQLLLPPPFHHRQATTIAGLSYATTSMECGHLRTVTIGAVNTNRSCPLLIRRNFQMNRREMLQAGLGLAVGAAVGVPAQVHAGHSGVVGQSVLSAAKRKVFKEQWIMRVYSLGGLTPNQVIAMEGL